MLIRSLAPRVAMPAAPKAASTTMLPYPALQSMFGGHYPKGMQWYWCGDFVKTLPDAAIDAQLEQAAIVRGTLTPKLERQHGPGGLRSVCHFSRKRAKAEMAGNAIREQCVLDLRALTNVMDDEWPRSILASCIAYNCDVL